MHGQDLPCSLRQAGTDHRRHRRLSGRDGSGTVPGDRALSRNSADSTRSIYSSYSPARSGTPAAAYGRTRSRRPCESTAQRHVLQKLTCRAVGSVTAASFTGQQEEEILAEEVLTEEAMRRRTQNEMSAGKSGSDHRYWKRISADGSSEIS
jgi:hypothetical protein